MDTVALWDTTSSSEDEEAAVTKLASIRRRILRDHTNILELPEKIFINNFALSKDAFMYVLDEIQYKLKNPIRSTAVTNIVKLAATLRFLIKGGYQQGTGDERLISLSQSSISAITKEVFEALEKILCPQMIKFFTKEEKPKNKLFFYKKSKFPGIIGAIGGTQIQIIRPHTDEHNNTAADAVPPSNNRKSRYCVYTMIICDFNMRIRAADAQYGGSSNESSIWGLSNARKQLKKSYIQGDKLTWLIGDSGYPLEPWLMIPYQSSTEDSPEAIFNTTLTKERNIIHKVFRILKGRFRCLWATREIHYPPEKAIKMFNICCALYNVCIDFKVPFEETEETNNFLTYTEECVKTFSETLPATSVSTPAASTLRYLKAEKIRDNIKKSLV